MPNLFVSDSNLLRPVRTMDDLTPYEREAITPNLLSNSDVVVAEPDNSVDSDSVLVATPVSNSAGYIPLVSAKPYVDPSAAKELSYSQADVGDLPPLDMNAPMGQEPLPETNDPWYGRIAGTIKNILNLGKEKASDYGSKVGDFVEKNPTALQDWANQYASSPFLAMARNERFDRMRAQANANLDREAKMNRTGSEAGALQIYKHFLGENGYGAPGNTPEQDRMLAQDAYAKTVAFLQSSRSNINIGGEGAKLFNKLNEQMAGDLYEAHNMASSYMPQIDRAINDIESGTLRTGGGSIGDAARRLIADWGMFSPGELAAMSNFDDLNMRMRSAIIEGFKGAISDKEQELITKALPSLGKSPAANAAMLKIYRLKQELANDSYYAFIRLAATVDEMSIQDEMLKYLEKRSKDTASKIEAIVGAVPKDGRNSNEGGLDISRLE